MIAKIERIADPHRHKVIRMSKFNLGLYQRAIYTLVGNDITRKPADKYKGIMIVADDSLDGHEIVCE